MIDLWQEIYGTIKRNKLRTFLTGFAVAWGIFMLIVLLGAGNGIIHAFEQNASERALNSIRLGGGWTTQSYEDGVSNWKTKTSPQPKNTFPTISSLPAPPCGREM